MDYLLFSSCSQNLVQLGAALDKLAEKESTARMRRFDSKQSRSRSSSNTNVSQISNSDHVLSQSLAVKSLRHHDKLQLSAATDSSDKRRVVSSARQSSTTVSNIDNPKSSAATDGGMLRKTTSTQVGVDNSGSRELSILQHHGRAFKRAVVKIPIGQDFASGEQRIISLNIKQVKP